MSMTGTFYLVLKPSARSYTNTLSARLAKKKPSLAAGEVVMLLDVDLPESLFKRPQLSAKVRVPPDQMGKTFITADVADNVAAVLSQQLGMRVTVSAEDVDHG
jgi:hypothetical protein